MPLTQSRASRGPEGQGSLDGMSFLPLRWCLCLNGLLERHLVVCHNWTIKAHQMWWVRDTFGGLRVGGQSQGTDGQWERKHSPCEQGSVRKQDGEGLASTCVLDPLSCSKLPTRAGDLQLDSELPPAVAMTSFKLPLKVWSLIIYLSLRISRTQFLRLILRLTSPSMSNRVLFCYKSIFAAFKL